ncbi:MAG TPA: cyclin [Gammaproteobacteria bacterium]|nr:cyclin [Gammaproteobacteria bacterium]
MRNRNTKRPIDPDDSDDPNEPVTKKEWTPAELAQLQDNAQQKFRVSRQSQIALPHSTEIINDKLGIPLKPAAEVKYDASQAKKKLVASIARVYEKKLEDDAHKWANSNDFNVFLPGADSDSDSDSDMDMAEYLPQFLSLESISVDAFLHMTLMIDTWFRYHPNERFGEENCYGLIVASLSLAHEFHDGNLNHEAFYDEDDKGEHPLYQQEIYSNHSVARQAHIHESKLCTLKNYFKEGIRHQFHYTREEYEAAEARFLSPEDQNPALGELTSALASGEFRHQSGVMFGQPLAWHLCTRDETKEVPQTPIMDKLITSLCERFETMIASKSGHLHLSTIFVSAKPPEVTLAYYLNRINRYAGTSNKSNKVDVTEAPDVCVFIQMMINIDLYLASSGDCFNQYNAYRLVLAAFLHAYKGLSESYYNNAYVAKMGGVTVTQLYCMEKLLWSSLRDQDYLNQARYEDYHFQLLPEYNLDLTPRERIAPATPAVTPAPAPAPEEPAVTHTRRLSR